MKRKYLTIVIPIFICVICGLYLPQLPVGLFTTMLFVGLATQNFMFQRLFSESIYEYSEQMAKKTNPIIASKSIRSRNNRHYRRFFKISGRHWSGWIDDPFEVLPTPNLMTTVLLSISLGFILSPIVKICS